MAARKPLSKAYDAIVIGSGVIGSSISLELSRAGLKTLTIDRNPHGRPTAPHRSAAGSIRAHFSTLESCKLAWEAYQYWGDWASHVGQPSGQDRLVFHENGCLMLHTPSSSTMLDKTEQFAQQLGIPIERWDRQEDHRRDRLDDEPLRSAQAGRRPEPFGHPDGGAARRLRPVLPEDGLHQRPAVRHDPDQAGQRAAGRRVSLPAPRDRHPRAGRQGTRGHGRGLRRRGPLRGEPRDRERRGPALAAGEQAGVRGNGIASDSRLTTRALRVEVAFLPLRGKASRVMSSADPDVGIYWRPEPGNRRILVGGLESESGTLGELVWNTLACRASLRIPAAAIPNSSSGVVSSYDVTEDWMPIDDKSAIPGYYQAIGTSGNQFKCAPVVGKLMTRIIGHEADGIDHDSTPVQFDLPLTGQTLNAAHFSRLRDAQQTTDSVIS